MKKGHIVTFTLDPKNPPKARKGELERFDAMRDEDIDYSDIPELDAKFWKNAKIIKPAPKKMVSLRVDEPVLKWFKKQGKGYQAYMNNVLRGFVEMQPPV